MLTFLNSIEAPFSPRGEGARRADEGFSKVALRKKIITVTTLIRPFGAPSPAKREKGASIEFKKVSIPQDIDP
jgi:hypothetical protein